ncbi:MAG: DNA repair protein RecN [Desulfobacula sp.]|nr:DNA repair protein RecN [Desulfobacula sp.]
MLSELAIKNFAIIDDLRISFENGFSVLTGETGAGKSMIISAVNLLLGSRASADLVRAGCDTAELEACFDLDENSHAWSVLNEQGMDAKDGLIVRRLISSSGKSRVFINSRQSTLDLLKQVTANLAGISSQHAHQGLLKEENHLDILDDFAQTLELKDEVKTLFFKLMPLKKERKQLIDTLEEKKKEQDLISFQVEEIEAAAIQKNEDDILEKKRQVLQNAAQIFEAINGAVHEVYDKDGSVIERLSYISDTLAKAGMAHEHLESVCDRISSTLFDLQDIVGELRDASETIDLDPASLEAVDQRLDLISKLKRKYGPTLLSLFETYEHMQGQLAQTHTIEKQIKANEQQIETLLTSIIAKAIQLSVLRKKAGTQLSILAKEQLGALEMGNAQFDVSFSIQAAKTAEDIATPDGEKIGPAGIDKIRFLLSPNPGESLKPLVKIASGGELSRIVLALKAVLSKNQSLETLIFDEVDAGIGGATSEKVGQKLKQLSKTHQVICITHLAQIAKYGSNQFRILKQVINDRTCTRIVPLKDKQDRVDEIARMIGGAHISQATRTHAKELLEQVVS